jgi:membrane-bound serine protease (ClpP class)
VAKKIYFRLPESSYPESDVGIVVAKFMGTPIFGIKKNIFGAVFALLNLLFGTFVLAQDPVAERKKFSKTVAIRIEGPITGLTEQFMRTSLEASREIGADLILLEINSPGGLLDSSLNIAHALRDIEFAKTVAYVPDEAISGGAIIALGCDEIWLSEFGQIGDAGPVAFGMDMQFRHAPEKIRSYLVQQVRQLAEAKQRPPAIAEAMVEMNTAVYKVLRQPGGEVWYLNEEELKSLADPTKFEKKESVLEARKDTFLTVGGQRAVDLMLAKGIVKKPPELLEVLGAEEPVKFFRVRWIERLVYFLNNPFVTFLLLAIGLIALYIEFSMPGIGLGSLVSIACFGVFFWSHFLGGTAGWLEVLIFVLGIAFILGEIFVIPGFGVAGISGFLLVFVALIMSLQDYGWPKDITQWRGTARGLSMVLGAFFIVTFVILALMRYAKMMPTFLGMALEPPSAEDIAPVDSLLTASSSHFENVAGSNFPAIGEVGITESILRPSGKARFGNSSVDVLTEGDFVEAGAKVRVIRHQSYAVIVRLEKDI